ncbi:MAG: hypothetical protein GF399_10090 [Candidatus Coatesbacteria bacterium]|nr:hypothetical protein [Candidatus Coatesbacteria bacterium]
MQRLIPILLALLTPLAAGAVEPVPEAPASNLGIHLGLGVGYLETISDTLPTGAEESSALGRFEVGLSYAGIIGAKFQIDISAFEWAVEEDRDIPVGHYLFSADLYTTIDLAERWRLRPALGYTFSSSLLDSLGTGFEDAHGLHAQLAGEFRIKEIIWVGVGVGYHFTGEYPTISVDDPDIDVPGSVDAQHFEVYAQVIFNLE